MSFKYICKECGEDPCVLEIAMGAGMEPYGCLFPPANYPKTKWVEYQPEPDKEKLNLIKALMDMCTQYCHVHDIAKCKTHKEGTYCNDMELTAGQLGLETLEKLGYAKKEKCGCYKLLWEKLNVE